MVQTQKKMLLSKIYKYSRPAVNIVSSKPFVGPLPRIKISFFLLSMHQRTHINAKYYHNFTNSATI